MALLRMSSCHIRKKIDAATAWVVDSWGLDNPQESGLRRSSYVEVGYRHRRSTGVAEEDGMSTRDAAMAAWNLAHVPSSWVDGNHPALLVL